MAMITFFIDLPDDEAACLPGDRAQVHIDVDVMGPDERKNYIEQIRLVMMGAFEQLWDAKPRIITEEELRALERIPEGD